MSVFVHETAIVDEGAKVGDDTKIWHFVHVSAGAQIGAGCVLGQNVFVGNKVVIGDNVKIQNNVSIYDNVILEDDVFCGPSMVFTNVSNPRSAFPQRDDFEDTVVRRGVTIGANATIVCGVELKEHAFVGAGAVITKDVPAFGLMIGNPARQLGWMCMCGHRLVEANKTVCAHCQRTYRLDLNTLSLAPE